MYGQSTVRQVELDTGNVLRSKALDPSDFGEGIARFGDKCVVVSGLCRPAPMRRPPTHLPGSMTSSHRLCA